MCGIAGFLEPDSERNGPELDALVTRMLETIVHRGPDHGQAWVDPMAGVALGNRRLAINDLSPSGAQPMHSRGGRYVLVLNGEIYNFRELRKELEARQSFQGHSDTEVLLAAIEVWGWEAALKRATGMFAVALWDKSERSLLLARDRLGEKPLYWSMVGGKFLFGSELKCLVAHPDWTGRICPLALSDFLRRKYIGGPRTIYQGTYKLPAGTWLKVPVDLRTLPTPQSYWSFQERQLDCLRSPLRTSFDESLALLEQKLQQVLRRQMIADVPLGAFLSGGTDSSLVVAHMQKLSHDPVRTFTIGFTHDDFDESVCARKVAEYLGTRHTELIVSESEALAVIPSLPRMFDEPFADTSQIPTFLVSKLAREQVTVSLSGDGGDELFAGYSRYSLFPRLWQRISILPQPVRRILARLLGSIPDWLTDRALTPLSGVFSRYGKRGRPSTKLKKLIPLLECRDFFDCYHQGISVFPDPGVLLGGKCGPEPDDMALFRSLPGTTVEKMAAYDTLTYLVDDILVKVDRAGMAVSLESRIPFLDHEFLELAWRIPLEHKVASGKGKVIKAASPHCKNIGKHLSPGALPKKRGTSVPGPPSLWSP